MTQELNRKLATLPPQPGVYLLKNAGGEVLYVGKARSLRARVRSYFQESPPLAPRTAALVQKVADLEYILTDSEREALLLESHLIKEHRPRYNVRLRDDKRYPYLKLTAELYPQLLEVRQVEKDGARYFGPFVDSGAMRRTVQLLRQIFRLRTCSYRLTGQEDLRPCLDYHLGLCGAPCQGSISPEDYGKQVEGAVRFLRGQQEEIVRELRQEMEAAAEALDFERAAKLRDQMRAVEKVVERQKIVSPADTHEDLLALARGEEMACVEVFWVRHGKVIGEQPVAVECSAEDSDEEVLTAFLKQYYAEAPDIPPRLLLPCPLAEADLLSDWLTSLRGTRVELHVPQRGDKRRLLELVQRNAERGLEQLLLEQAQRKDRAEEGLTELRDRLKLDRPPRRIECYDISTTQGREAVGSMVVFKEGRPSKQDYRRFKIRLALDHADDYAMMREVLRRRFQAAQEGHPQFQELPDLVLVDGGPGQLNVALEVLQELEVRGVAAVGLAKRFEQVFRPGEKTPLLLEERSRARQLLQALRDEAHRFANEYHRKLRRRTGLHSILDDIPYVGPKRRTALLSHFASPEAIQRATVEELAAVPGMDRRAAEAVHRHLHREA
jgi:excinuclease ABC subunit C